MVKVNITLDDGMYTEFMQDKPLGVKKSVWIRNLAYKQLILQQDRKRMEGVITKNVPGQIRTGNYGGWGWFDLIASI